MHTTDMQQWRQSMPNNTSKYYTNFEIQMSKAEPVEAYLVKPIQGCKQNKMNIKATYLQFLAYL